MDEWFILAEGLLQLMAAGGAEVIFLQELWSLVGYPCSGGCPIYMQGLSRLFKKKSKICGWEVFVLEET